MARSAKMFVPVRVTSVSRVHDMGGQTGFGPVPADDGGPAFAADWEARVYALAAVLRQRGLFNGDELRDAIERLGPEEYLGASYYERWLGALELLAAEKGVP
jgi:nitrile hydratase subunit beta